MERTQYYPTSLSKTQIKKRKRKKFPNVFFKKELVSVFEHIEDPQTIVACFLTFFCALRNGEVSKLRWKDVDLVNRRLKVVDGKNHKDGFVPISSLAIPVLQRWQAMHLDDEFVFPSEKNKEYHITTSALLKSFKNALRKAGMEIPTEKNAAGRQQHQYKFHTLRHSRCTHLLNNGVPIQKVQYFMRHDKIDTTMTYAWITNPELNRMVEEVDKGGVQMEPTNNQLQVAPEPQEPLKIARRRLALGDISPREYKKIVSVLSE
jgi:integrase